MKKVMSKKALSLLVMLSAGLSTSFAAPNAMDAVRGYTETLEQALVLHDQTNIDNYAKALTDLVLTGKVDATAYNGAQTYGGQELKDKQIEKWDYQFRTTEAKAGEIAAIYRAIDTLALTYQLVAGKGGIGNYLSKRFAGDNETTRNKEHFGLAQGHYQQKLQELQGQNGLYHSALNRLMYASDLNQSPVPYAMSTYEGVVNVKDISPLQRLPSDALKQQGWINAFHVTDQAHERVLNELKFTNGRVDIPTTVVSSFTGAPANLETKERAPQGVPAGYAPLPADDFDGEGKGLAVGQGDGPPPSYKANSRADVITNLEQQAQNNPRFTPIIADLRSDANKKVGNAIVELAKIARAPATQVEFHQAFNALSALSGIDGKILASKLGKPWVEVGLEMVANYARALFKQNLGQGYSGVHSPYRDVVMSDTSKGLIEKLVEFVRYYGTDVVGLRAARASFETLGATELGNQALTKDRISLANMLKDIDFKIADTQSAVQIAGAFKKALGQRDSGAHSPYRDVVMSDTSKDLIEKLVEFVRYYGTDVVGLRAARASFETLGATELGNQALTKARISLANMLKDIDFKIADTQSAVQIAGAFKEALGQRDSGAYSPYRDVVRSDTSKDLIEKLVEFVRYHDTDVVGLRAARTAFKELDKTEGGKKAFAQARITLQSVLKTIKDNLIYSKARSDAVEALKSNDSPSISVKQVENSSDRVLVLQVLITEIILEEKTQYLASLKKFVETDPGQVALGRLNFDVIPDELEIDVKDDAATRLAKVQKYIQTNMPK